MWESATRVMNQPPWSSTQQGFDKITVLLLTPKFIHLSGRVKKGSVERPEGSVGKLFFHLLGLHCTVRMSDASLNWLEILPISSVDRLRVISVQMQSLDDWEERNLHHHSISGGHCDCIVSKSHKHNERSHC